MKDTNLTLLLILKDRPHFTERLMHFLSFMEYPYKILIADGGKNKGIQRLLSNPNTYPGVDYEYVRYPFDSTVDDFHKKMSDVVDKIKTPITSVLDNDDHLLLSGYRRCLKYLKDNPTYSSARGQMNGMQVLAHNDFGSRGNGVCGPLAIHKNMYDKYTEDIIGDTARERVEKQTKQFHGNWHNLARTNHIQACWKMLNVIQPKNMRFTEQITAYLNTTWGDSHRGDFPWMLHQNSQRVQLGNEKQNLNSHFPEQVDWVEMPSWAEDFNKMTEVMGVAISEYDGTPVSEAMQYFTEVYPLKLMESNLTALFREKIGEAKKLGYDEKRIEKLKNVVRKYKVKEIPQVGEIQGPDVSDFFETTLLANFITGGINQYNGTRYPIAGDLL